MDLIEIINKVNSKEYLEWLETLSKDHPILSDSEIDGISKENIINISLLSYLHDSLSNKTIAYRDYFIDDTYLTISYYFCINGVYYRISTIVDGIRKTYCEKLNFIPSRKSIYYF